MTSRNRSQSLRRNFYAALTDVVGWTAGSRFFAPDTVLQELLTHVTASKLVIGLSAAAPPAFMNLTSFLVAPRVERLRRAKPYVMLIATVERAILFLLVPLMLLVAPRHPQALAVLLPLVLVAFYLVLGCSVPAYTVLIAKTIPARQRGALYGYGGALGQGLSLGSGLLIPLILRSSAPWGGFPNGFATCFLIGWALLTLSYLPLGWMREPSLEPTATTARLRDYLAEVIKTFRADRAYQYYMAASILYPFAAMPVLFYVTYSLQRLGGTVGESGIFTVLVALGAIGGFVWGILADRWDNRLVLRVGVTLLGVSSLAAIWAPSRPVLWALVVLSALANRGVELAGFNILMEFAPPARVPRYYAIAAFITFWPRLIAPALGGWIADLWGFSALFLAAGAAALLTERLLHRMRDPRSSSAAA
ncbi:MAG: hypothetical protein KatS3mg115_2148 [Candidatus Poribacteria bacterium]|nr:MAG: hypothetical protein KatS3mg115_2148 [Candidatus Poribacteria bacterium]